MQLLQHASGCRNQQCPSANCNKMKVCGPKNDFNHNHILCRICLNMAPPAWPAYRAVVRFVAVSGRCCKFMHVSVAETPAWYRSADNWKSSSEPSLSNKLKWMSDVGLPWTLLIARSLCATAWQTTKCYPPWECFEPDLRVLSPGACKIMSKQRNNPPIELDRYAMLGMMKGSLSSDY